MKLNKELVSSAVLDAMGYYVQQLEQITSELDFAFSRALVHHERICNGDDSFFEQWMYAGAYQRCIELLEQVRVVDQSIKELEQSRAFVLIQAEWED